jgi:hypothetical protein
MLVDYKGFFKSTIAVIREENTELQLENLLPQDCEENKQTLRLYSNFQVMFFSISQL